MRFHFSASAKLVVLALSVGIGCGGGPGSQLTIPDSPEGTVEVVVNELVQHQPEIVWRALPPSYQQDVADLTRDFADTVDPAVFDRAVAVARKGVVVLQGKKDLILGSAIIERSQVDAETVDIYWETAVHMLDALLASDVAELSTLRELDVEAFLATTGSDLMDHASQLPAENDDMESFGQRVAALEEANVNLKSEDGDQAVVMLEVPDQDPTGLRLIRVEDRWIPAELEAQWPRAVAELRAKIELLNGEEAAQTRVRVLFGIGIVEGFIDQIDQMETSDEIDALIGGIIGNIMATQVGAKVTEG